MADTVLNITDSQLLIQLKASHIAPGQKTQLEALLPRMSDGEKAELLNLISRSHQEYDKATKTYGETIDHLGKEYKETLKNEDNHFRKDLEGIEHAENAQSLKAIEAEVVGIDLDKNLKTRARGSKKHTFRNLVLILAFFGILAGGALYILNHLS